MRTLPVVFAVVLSALAATWTGPTAVGDEKKDSYPALPGGSLDIKDPAFEKLIDKNAKIEKLADGFAWSEGPVWVKRDGGFLLFSDIPPNKVMKFQEDKGVTLFLFPAGYTGDKPRGGEPGSNGLLLDPQGRLVLCEHGDRRIARIDNWKEPKKKTTLADKFEGKRFNSPNDAVYKSNGDLYFTDPPYGLVTDKKMEYVDRDMDYCGVFRLSKDGKLTLLTKEMSRPNGIAFSPDEKTLYVANSDPLKPIWMAFPVKEDGTLGKGKVFFDSTRLLLKGILGLPDGMKVDKDGNLFATGPGGVLVFSPDGKHLGTIKTGVATANCGWGDDGTVLYITAHQNLCRIKTKTKGKGF